VAAHWWLIGGAGVFAGAVLLGALVHPHVGSGLTCEGIGFGCTPERDFDTALVVAVYGVTALAALVTAWWRFSRGRPWRAVLAGGVAVTVIATGLATWSQLPRYPASPGPLSAARAHWESVLGDGRAVAPAGTPLGNALHGIRRTGPIICLDAYGRATGSRRFEWASGDAAQAYGGLSGAATAAALGRWAERLRGRGVEVTIEDPGGDPASDRRLRVRGSETDEGGVFSVRASSYISELEITASTGCHRS
jgi:hypothetical protein